MCAAIKGTELQSSPPNGDGAWREVRKTAHKWPDKLRSPENSQ